MAEEESPEPLPALLRQEHPLVLEPLQTTHSPGPPRSEQMPTGLPGGPEPLLATHCWPADSVSCNHRQAAALPGRRGGLRRRLG